MQRQRRGPDRGSLPAGSHRTRSVGIYVIFLWGEGVNFGDTQNNKNQNIDFFLRKYKEICWVLSLLNYNKERKCLLNQILEISHKLQHIIK